MRVGPDLRVYGEARGLSAAAWAGLAPDCPFEEAVYADGRLSLEHEGRWLDAAAFAEELVAALGPGGDGSLDVIDNEAWTITRYVLAHGKMTSQTFSIDDILEYSKGEGNF